MIGSPLFGMGTHSWCPQSSLTSCSFTLCQLSLVLQGYSLSDSPVPEQKQSAKAFHGVALCCNIFTIVYYVVAAILTIVSVGTTLGLYFQYQSYYYDYNWGCYEDCSPHYDGDYGYYHTGCTQICS